ncbi:cupredoxin domain-containing protein [Propionivibrio soli]|uniref:cupredoxin domain-containing protein n=1 Tax=Propionivibrio soli TaxID=2976531 RepID=UPI0021E85946|nr:cupredoxin family protein [Propionivibrio soli]
MTLRFAGIIPLAVALVHPTTSHATGAGDHRHDSSASAHAAALGQPGVLKDVNRTVELDMTDAMRFTPERLNVRRGETVRFVVKNSGMLKHEMVLGTAAELKAHGALMAKNPNMEHADPNAVSVDPGKTGEFVWKFTKAGTFDFACLLPGHLESGMKGRITVKN